jgi:hypothetical protein
LAGILGNTENLVIIFHLNNYSTQGGKLTET